jgi:histidyl-tRNA synthetase
MSEVKRIKPSLSKGTRDFLPQEVAKRNFIFDTIKSVFRKYGFEQIETPAIERLETLTGKYGEEGDKLLFKILNSGDYLSDVRSRMSDVSKLTPQEVTPLIAEKGLRYDLTVPLARYVVQHQDKLAFPFKRFHIGPVWRADRPQKGRYQEFYQCDADVIGSSSLLNEVELTMIYLEVFEKLNIPVSVRLTNRKMIDEVLGRLQIHENRKEVVTIIDKLDKVKWEGEAGIAAQLKSLGLSDSQINSLNNYLFNTTFGNYKEYVSNLDTLHDVEFLMHYVKDKANVLFDPTLMRGLDYYTGTVWEVTAKEGSITSSLGGGGRYDNLTEMFGGQNLSGVGISFGIERIYDVMEELNLFPATIAQGVKVLFVPREAAVEEFTFQQVQTLRNAGIAAEIFLGNVKKQKHFTYAEQKGIPFMVEIGGNEMQSKQFRLRNVLERKEEGAGMYISDLLQKFI